MNSPSLKLVCALLSCLAAACAAQKPAPEELPPANEEEAIALAVAPLGTTTRVGIVTRTEPKFFTVGGQGDPNDVLPYAAASPPLTALVITAQANAGTFGLDDRVGVKTCSERVTSAYCFRGTATTYRHLLRHTSGLPADPANSDEFDDGALQDLLARYELSIEPGKRFRESSVGYAALGAAAARTAREPFLRLTTSTIIEPWGLGATTFEGSSVPATLWPSYGVRSTATDMLRVAEFHRLPDTAGELSDEIRENLRVATQIEAPEGSQAAAGWFYEPKRDVYWYASVREGASSLAFSPTREISVTMVTETSPTFEQLSQATLGVFDQLARVTSPE